MTSYAACLRHRWPQEDVEDEEEEKPDEDAKVSEEVAETEVNQEQEVEDGVDSAPSDVRKRMEFIFHQRSE